MKTVVLRFKRLPELVSDKHPYVGGCTVLEDDNVAAGGSVEFDRVFFEDMITRLCRVVSEHEADRVIFHRVDRPGLKPTVLADHLVHLFKTDPVSAIRALSPMSSLNVPYGAQVLADAFGEHVYVRMVDGSVEDPITGKLRTLAYRVSDGSFMVRGDGDDPATWLSISLVGVRATPSETDILSAAWATVRCTDLLGRATQYYLPRKWNFPDSWITDEKLSERLTTYRKEKP